MPTATAVDSPSQLVRPAMSIQPLLAAENVSAWFHRRKVLDRVSLAFPPASVTALIGPSGCGKSSFLRTLNRLHELIPGAALAGTVTYDDEDIYASHVDPVAVRRQIGMVFQKPAPFPSLTIKGNVLAGPRLAGIPTPEPDALVEQTLTAAGLWSEVKDRLDESALALSGGQQQRLVIARALALDPHVLLMDEPCSALDPASTAVVEETIRQLGQRITIVLVTHNLHQARRVADHTAFFLATENSPGELIETGPTEALYTGATDRRTTDYLLGRFG